jgi:hypothetical protein
MRELETGRRGLGFDGRFLDQHDGNVILDRVEAVALSALQALGILAVVEGLLAGRTDENLEQIRRKHDSAIVAESETSRVR